MKFKMTLAAITCLSAIMAQPALACTDIRVSAKDGSEIIARTLEFAMQLNSDIVSTPRGTAYKTTAPSGKPGMAWQAKYGYVFVDGLKQLFTVDGMNEQGLSFEYLYLPADTQYQAVPAGAEAQAIPYYYFGDWVLGNFKTVDEVRQALGKIFVFEQTLPATGSIVFPLHAAIHDASGKGIVVEFVKGQMLVHDYIGVMTNSPTYPWHVSNLPQYFNLSPYNPEPVVVNGVAYGANGEGAGMLGLPGDISPASRFVRMAYMLQYSYKAENALTAVNLAEHIINNVDIPAGVSRSKNNGQDTFETTQWTLFKDLTHKIFYYHTYDDMTLRSIDLSQIDFSEKAPRLVMPMASAPTIVDVTAKFKQAISTPLSPATPAPTAAAAPAQTPAPAPAAKSAAVSEKSKTVAMAEPALDIPEEEMMQDPIVMG